MPSVPQDLYYEHLPDATCLENCVARRGILIEPQPLLYGVLANLIDALCDIVEQSSFAICCPLTLANVFLIEGGTQVVLGRVRWGERLSPLEDR